MKNYILSGINLTFLATFVDKITDWLGLALLIISVINAIIPLFSKIITDFKNKRYNEAFDTVEDVIEIVEDTIEQVSDALDKEVKE